MDYPLSMSGMVNISPSDGLNIGIYINNILSLPMRKKFITPYTNPKVRFYEIIAAFNYPGEIFTAKDVSQLFGITYPDARVRMFHLKRWNLVKVVKKARIPNAAVYKISNWGKKYLEDQACKLKSGDGEVLVLHPDPPPETI